MLFGLIQNLVVMNFAPGELTLEFQYEHFVENRKVLSLLLSEIAPCR